MQSIQTGEPVAGATVEVLAKNGLTSVLAAHRRAGGTSVSEAGRPVARARAAPVSSHARRGDTSFLPFNRADRQLDLSRFDVGGVANARTADQLGRVPVLRSRHLPAGRRDPRRHDRQGRRLDAKPLAGLPLEVEVIDARGLTVKRERIKLAARRLRRDRAHHARDVADRHVHRQPVHRSKDGKRRPADRHRPRCRCRSSCPTA